MDGEVDVPKLNIAPVSMSMNANSNDKTAPTTTDSNSTQQTPLLSKKKIKDENQNDDQYNSKISPVFREIRSGLDMEIKTKSNETFCATFCCCIDGSSIHGENGCGNFFRDLLRHFWRGLDTNLSDKLVSEKEKSFLVEKGIAGSYSANYLVWRRSTLMVVMLPLLLNFALSILNQVQDIYNWRSLKQSNQEVYSALGDIMVLVTFLGVFDITLNFIAFIIAGFALRRWYDWAYSKKLVIWSWCIYFFSNFALSMFPFRWLVSFKMPTTIPSTDIPTFPNPSPSFAAMLPTLPNSMPTLPYDMSELEENFQMMVGSYLGIYFFLQLAPPSLTLSIAVIRTCLNVRSLFPGSSIPGLVSALVPLIYSPLVWCCFVMIMQTVGDTYLIIAITLFLFAPFLFICCGRYTFKPMTASDAHKYAFRLRWLFISLVILSLFSFTLFIGRLRFGAFALDKILTEFRMLEFLISFICEYFFTNVFAADLLISAIVLIRSYERDKFDEQIIDILKERDFRTDQFLPILSEK